MKVRLSGANVAGFGLNTASLFRKSQMEQLGKLGIATMRARVAKGIGSNDAPMRPLKVFPIRNRRGQFVRRQSYAEWKVRHGLQGFRDLYGEGTGGGHMLDNFTIRYVDESLVRMAFTSRVGRAKAITNERREPFLGWSPSDERVLIRAAERMFSGQIEVLRQKLATSAIQSVA